MIANIPDLALAPATLRSDRRLYEKIIEVFNEHVEATAARHRFALVDLFAGSQSLRGRAELFSPDGFHPSAEGYEEWARELWPALESALVPAPRRPALKFAPPRAVCIAEGQGEEVGHDAEKVEALVPAPAHRGVGSDDGDGDPRHGRLRCGDQRTRSRGRGEDAAPALLAR